MPIRNEIRDATCVNGGTWYVCGGTPGLAPYMGCCTVDACQHGCRKDQDRTPRSSGSLSSGLPTSASGPHPSITSPSAQVETFASVSSGYTVLVPFTDYSVPISHPTSDPASIDRTSSGKAHVGAIIGGTIGGVAFLAAIVFLLFFLRRRRIKEEQSATLPPTYPSIRGGDMLEQFTSTLPTSNVGTKNTVCTDDASLESVPQLDSVAIMPTNEIGSDALGVIPELPANEKYVNPFETPRTSEIPKTFQKDEPSGIRVARDQSNHVMSWANLNSMGNRNATCRLSQPHAVPEGSVWENMSPAKDT